MHFFRVSNAYLQIALYFCGNYFTQHNLKNTYLWKVIFQFSTDFCGTNWTKEWLRMAVIESSENFTLYIYFFFCSFIQNTSWRFGLNQRANFLKGMQNLADTNNSTVSTDKSLLVCIASITGVPLAIYLMMSCQHMIAFLTFFRTYLGIVVDDSWQE